MGRWQTDRQNETANRFAEIAVTEGNQKNPIDAFLAARIEQAKSASAETPAAELQNFHTHVLPILRSECFRCHGDKDQGGLALNSREMAIGGGAIEPGDPHASEMIARLRSDDPDVRMPPTGKPLAEEKIQILEQWITKGARWSDIHLTAGQTEFASIVDDATLNATGPFRWFLYDSLRDDKPLDPDGRRAASNRNHYGQPHRSWMLVSLSNERDRPSL